MEPPAAAASSVQNEANNSPAAALSRTRSATICIVSLLFTCLATTTLLHITAGDKEQDEYLISAAVVRGLSPLVTAYLLSLTVALHGITWDSATTFLRATCLLLLAAGVAKLISAAPIAAGAAAMFLVTVDSAVVLGGALAVLRQKAGADVTAMTTAMSASPYRSRAEVRHARWCRTTVAASTSIAAVVASVSVAIVMWFAPEKNEDESHHGGGGEEELFLFVVMLLAGPLLVATRQLFILEGSPLQVETSEFLVNSVVGVVGWVFPMVVADGLVGGNAAGIVIWAGTLGSAGFFGYGRAVDAVFEELMAVKRSEPRTAGDASGLLVGRDEEDACSAHIDASTSVCLDCAVRPGCRC